MKCLICLLMLISLVCVAAAQQSAASLSGTITDATGGALSGAVVTVINTGTNITYNSVTTRAGQYNVQLLPPGSYDISVSAPSFKTELQKGIVLQVGQDGRVDVKLEIGAASEQVVVSADEALTDTESAAVGTVIDNKKVVELPLNGRQFYSLALLSPGVFPPVPGSQLSFRGGINVAGSNEVSNYFTLDGFNNVDANISGPSLRPSVDAIQEFKVVTGTYEAEYGHNTGGQVVVTLKSGTNKFHGNIYEFLRNDIIEAKPYFTPAGDKPPLKRNQFGGTFGGPILRDKAFFFFNYEGLRSRKGLAFTSTVPSAAMIAGTFPGRLYAPEGYAADTWIYNPATSTSTLNPAALNTAQTTAYTAGQALLAFYPAATSNASAGGAPSNNYNFSGLEKETDNQFTLRLDETVSKADTMFATLNYFNGPVETPNNPLCGDYTIPGFICNAGLTTQLYGGGWNHVFTPNLLNSFRAGFQRLRQPRFTESSYNYDARYGIPAFGANPPSDIGGVPTTTITGYASFGNASNLPQDRADNTYDFLDNFFWTLGKHSIKMGAEDTFYRTNMIYYFYGSGGLEFLGYNTGNAVADGMLGLPYVAAQSTLAPKLHIQNTYIGAYVQDEYRVLNNLTLNYGIRWENFTPPSSKDHTLSSFDPTGSGTPIQSGLNGEPAHPYAIYNGNFGPRIGISYQPFHSQKTVLRAGYGITYNSATIENAFQFILTGPPLHEINEYIGPNLSLPNPFVGGNGPTLLPGGVSRNYRPGQIQNWSMGLQQQLGPTLLLEVTYLGSVGHHLTNIINLNQPLPSTGTAAQVAAAQPYPEYSTIQWVESEGVSNYHSLQFKLQKNYSHGLSFLIAETFGKSLDDTDGVGTGSAASPAFAQDSRNIAYTMYGRSDFDIRNRLVVSPVYELPFGGGKAYLNHGAGRALLGGFQVSAIISTQTGSPFTAGLSTSVSGYNGILGSNTGNSAIAAGIDRPNLVPGQNPNAGPKSKSRWFNTAAFELPAPGTFGNAGRNILEGPGFTDVDLNLNRNFKLPHETVLQFRFEAFNLFNHPNFGLPSANVSSVMQNNSGQYIAQTSSTFGPISSAMANDARDFQAALKLSF